MLRGYMTGERRSADKGQPTMIVFTRSMQSHSRDQAADWHHGHIGSGDRNPVAASHPSHCSIEAEFLVDLVESERRKERGDQVGLRVDCVEDSRSAEAELTLRSTEHPPAGTPIRAFSTLHRSVTLPALAGSAPSLSLSALNVPLPGGCR